MTVDMCKQGQHCIKSSSGRQSFFPPIVETTAIVIHLQIFYSLNQHGEVQTDVLSV